MEDEMKSAKEAITENQKLKQEIDVSSLWLHLVAKKLKRRSM